MATLEDFTQVSAADGGLCVVSTLRRNGTMQASVVNAGVLRHPATGKPAVAFVAAGGTRKLDNLRKRPAITVVARSGFQWVAVEGTADLLGPDDPSDAFDGEGLRQLLRDIFSAAGGTHDDWSTYDWVMAEERRAAVLVTPARVYTNG
jgi:PPOX class probable F420-dependent enzyme